MAMTWRVFLRFEADEYTTEGIDKFYRFITDDVLYMMFKQGEYRIFGCFENEKIIGLISVRDKNHISLLFVDENYQHQGIGAALIRYMCDYLLTVGGQTFTTVDASPYAVGFYHRMGFVDTDRQKCKNGIKYTPMKFFL